MTEKRLGATVPSSNSRVDPDPLVFRVIIVLYALFVLFVPGGGHAL